ncbi:MAG TPA: hypothetical protein VNO32_40165, partial [Candidatus Acidoferrum sp.]|nr:hypothetical protein [Candidatus Acidoferrum sp.]
MNRSALFSLSLLAFMVGMVRAPSPAPSDTFDGPAELPRVLIKSSVADTPAPGRILMVKQGDNLQRAINDASCGDTLKLQAGAVFQGLIQVPAKPCDDGHWIVLRTSTSDKDLPAEGVRLMPCYAGVASLPGRPDFHCTKVENVLARLEFAGNGGSGPLLFLPGANHYRFLGLEITRANSEASITALAQAREGATANHIIFDRVWMHGTAQAETRRGVALRSMTYAGIVDSFFSDFHCVAVTGSCVDSQTITGGSGDDPGGPYKIVNNFLESAGENVIFGGGPATTTPGDIEIRRNHLFKPMIWKEGEPGFVGGVSGRPFIVKNHFELKNAQRVLFEDNLLENTWGGFSQTGFSILLTPKNQENKCPACQVTDITIRSIKIRNVGSVFQIANGLSDAGGASSGGGRYSIHDVLADDVRGKNLGGAGNFVNLGSVAPPLHDVRIEHVTAFVPHFLISIQNTSSQKVSGFTLANNLLYSADLQFASAGGGPQNCAFRPDAQGPSGVIKSCFENSTFTHNVIVEGSGWPSDNITPKNAAAAGLPEKAAGLDRYRVCRKKSEVCKNPSPAIAAGTDGKDVGADVDSIEKALE